MSKFLVALAFASVALVGCAKEESKPAEAAPAPAAEGAPAPAAPAEAPAK